MELRAFYGVGRRTRPSAARTTIPGFVNPNRQEVMANTGAPSPSFAGQVIYKLRCRHCQAEYGANGCDVHHRRSPQCQGGGPGEGLREPAAGLFG